MSVREYPLTDSGDSEDDCEANGDDEDDSSCCCDSSDGSIR